MHTNSYTKGQEFELRTKSVLEKLLHNSQLKLKVDQQGELWIVPKDSSTFHHKKYQYFYGGETVIDISVENQEKSSVDNFLIVIECKSYHSKHKIGIDEIQEFNTRLNDINATKGIFVTSSSYQSGALDCARAHNIALVRIDDNNKDKWFLHRIGGFLQIPFNEFRQFFLRDDVYLNSLIIDGFTCSMSWIDYLCQFTTVPLKWTNRSLN